MPPQSGDTVNFQAEKVGGAFYRDADRAEEIAI
jgi:hypothetical protein